MLAGYTKQQQIIALGSLLITSKKQKNRVEYSDKY